MPTDPDDHPPRLPWPCVVNLPAARQEPGGVRKRFSRSFGQARDTWERHPALLRSLLRWGAAAALVAATVSVLLARGSRPAHIALAAGIQGAWMAWWLFFLALHLGLVRGDDGGPLRPHIGLPNGLSVLRILLIPTLGWAVLAYPRLTPWGPWVATLIFVHGFTDVVDGRLARLMRWQTLLGRNLDHGADVLICAGLALAEQFAGLLPTWLTALYVVRYLGAGAMGIWGLATRPDVRIAPSWIGKLSTLVAGSALFLVIAQPLVAPDLAPHMGYVHWTAGVSMVLNIIALTAMAVLDRAFDRSRRSDAAKRLDRGP